MASGIAAIIGAAIGAIATIGGVIVQTILSNRADSLRRREARDSDRERQRRELAQRYLFQLQDAVVSLRLRLENWAHRGGQPYAESVDPGYWNVTTLYAVGRALAAERILSLEGVYTEIEDQFPELAESLRGSGVDHTLQWGFRRLFYYHRLALAESLLEERSDGYRLLMYTEWRRRYEDPSSGLDQLLEPTTASLQSLVPEQDLDELISALADIASELGKATNLPVKAIGATVVSAREHEYPPPA